MAVRTGERTEGKLKVLNDARILAAYTLDICKKDTVFPKSSRWIAAKRIMDECLDAMSCITQANTFPVTDEYIEKRETLQYQARAHLNTMLAFLDVIYHDSSFHIAANSYVHWVRLINDTRVHLGGWMKSDRERIKAK